MNISPADPKGFLPLELLDRSIHPNIFISGRAPLTFPTDERYVDEQGQPRRLEWVTWEQAQRVMQMYNRGTQILFRVAQDIVEASRQASFRQQVEATLEQSFGQRIADLEARISALELDARIEAGQTKRPRTKKG